MSIPVIRVSGDASSRGRAYGEQARDRIHASIEAYGRVFAHYATWDWARVTEEALRFVPALSDFDPSQVDEIQGIADGAAVDFADVLAINVRTEIMFAAKVRAVEATLPRMGECSSFAVAADDGTTYLGQNWDWLVHAFDTVVRLEVTPDRGPAYVTVVEAGLLCKFGMNSAGLAVGCNALVNSLDRGEPGVPFHSVLRALISCSTPAEALSTVQSRFRSSSANYLVAHHSGLAIDMECEAGDMTRIHLIQPDERGVILHTNHFVSGDLHGTDVGLWNFPDSPFRLQRLQRALRRSPHAAPPTWFTEAAADHAGHPYGVCCHPDSAAPLEEQGATVVSTVMDLSSGVMSLWDGYPCSAVREDLDLSSAWGESGVWAGR